MQFRQIRGATSIITYSGTRFLIDPFFAPKGGSRSVPSPYNTLGNPLVELPVPIEEIIAVDAVIVTHMHHFDHFDEAAAKALPKSMPMFTQSPKEAEDMRDLGFKNVTALTDEGVFFAKATLRRVDALHGHGVRADDYYSTMNTPAEASGVVFTAQDEKTLYLAGDTIWYDGVQKTIEKHRPGVIAVNAANAQFFDGTPLLMGMDGFLEVAKTAPDATLVATHMDAVNHARVTRVDLRKFVNQQGIANRVHIPEDGEEILL